MKAHVIPPTGDTYALGNIPPEHFNELLTSLALAPPKLTKAKELYLAIMGAIQEHTPAPRT